MKYCTKAMLGENQQESLFALLYAITASMAESHKQASLERPQRDSGYSLGIARGARSFPLELHNPASVLRVG